MKRRLIASAVTVVGLVLVGFSWVVTNGSWWTPEVRDWVSGLALNCGAAFAIFLVIFIAEESLRAHRQSR